MYMAHERRQYILRLLEQRGRIRSAALAAELGVTDETIRTDLVALQQKGLLRRVHGGAEYAVPTAPTAAEEQSPRLDVQLAQLVAEHIPAGAVIYAEAAPFTRVLAAQLADKPCTFITNSPQLALHLSPQALPHSIFCTGGELDKNCRLFHGPDAEQALQAMPPHLCLLQPKSLSPTHAGYNSPVAAHWAQLASSLAQQCIIAVPSAALHAAPAPHTVALPHFRLITEDNLPPHFLHHPSVQTVPYISAELLRQADRFDY